MFSVFCSSMLTSVKGNLYSIQFIYIVTLITDVNKLHSQGIFHFLFYIYLLTEVMLMF